MSVRVTLPALGESVTEGTVTRWLKKVGDPVAADEPLLEVSTDKVDTEIPSPAAGVVLEIVADEDDVVEVGGVLAVIGEPSESTSGGAPATPASEAAAPEAAAPEAAAPESAAPVAPAPAAATPTAPPAGEPVASFPPPSTPPIGQAPPPAAPAAPVAPPPVAPAAAPPAPPAEPTAVAAEPSPTAPIPMGGAAGGPATEVTLPALGESVTEGTVTRWLKSVGDDVATDEPLLEVSTDKVDTEIPSPVAGKLLEIRVEEDEVAEVGAVLALIGSPESQTAPAPSAPEPAAPATTAPAAGAAQPEPAAPTAPAPAVAPAAPPTTAVAAIPEAPPAGAQQPAETPPAAPAAPAPAASAEGPYVTPLVRKMAKDAGVDLTTVTGTGVGGRIRKQDVEAAIASAATAVSAAAVAAPAVVPAAAGSSAGAPATKLPVSDLRGTSESMSRLRRVIAERMMESIHGSAQLTTVVEVDMTAVARLRDARKEEFAAANGVKLTFLPFFALAAVEALKAYPQVNATLDQAAGTVTYPDHENLGIAVDTERGLLVPVVHDAGDMNITGLAVAIAQVAERTRTNALSPDDLSGGTFTITNTGSRGALFDTPIINAPQSAILGTGAIVKRPVVVSDPAGGDALAVRSMVYLALSYDHRIIDGADAARFLAAMKARLEEGAFAEDF